MRLDEEFMKKFKEYDFKDKDDKKYPDNKEKKKHDEVALACGQVCEEVVDVIKCQDDCQIASLQIDIKKLKNPTVKLDFSSIAKFMDLDAGFLSAANAAFTLKLYRIKDCCKKLCIGSWRFGRFYNDLEIIGTFLASTTDSFCFTKCDYPKCDKCVEYILEVTDRTFDESILTKLYLTNINFNAIAVSQCDD